MPPPSDDLRTILVQLSRNWAYSYIDDCVKRVFDRYPENTEFIDVLEKVTVLDSLYRTNLRFEGVTSMTHHITNHGEEIDDSLKSRSEKYEAFYIIRDFQRKNGNDGKWSFAAKYCRFQVPEHFPIYDDRAYYVIKWLQEQDVVPKEYKFQTYEEWKKGVYLIGQLMGSTNLKEIDQALWNLSEYVLEDIHGRSGPRILNKSIHQVCLELSGHS